MEPITRCIRCQKEYSTEGNMRRHIKRKHEHDMSLLVPSKYKKSDNFPYNCNCGKNFTNKHHFLYHLKSHTSPTNLSSNNSDHQEDQHQTLGSKKCPMCPYSDNFTDNLIEHFQKRHEIVIKTQTLEFFSQNTFNTWKIQTEQDTNSSFVKKYTKRSRKGTITFFLCNRSGNYVEKESERLRSLKTQGSNKIDAFCPASIKILVDSEEKITVNYIETHIGHINDLGHLFLNHLDRAQIASKIAMKIPFETILDDIRDSVSNSTLYRIHLLSKKDLYNIESSFNLQSDSIRHTNDCLSVEAWINEFKDKDNMHVFYKSQETVSEEYPQLKSEDFMLVIMNQPQCDILLKYGSDVICIDGTHGMKHSNFELITLLVLDDMRQGFPCSFCITSRTDKDALKVFFSCIEKWTGKISPTVFMSDMADTFYNAWVEIMEIPKLR